MEINRILEFKTIAVVGCSRDPAKDAHRIPRYLKEHGYNIIPINPFSDEILGEKCYPSLLELPEELKSAIEIIDIFRPSMDVLPIVEQAVELKKEFDKPYVIWMQLGIKSKEGARIARDAGMAVGMDRCLKIEHMRRGF